MAVNVKFDLVGNPEPPTIILSKRNGDKLGQLDVNAESIELSDKFNDASEMSFTLNKYVDGKLTPLWDKVVDFKLVWCKEWDLWFEIKVELDEATETVKTVFCTQLGQAELSQINLYDIHINEEGDPNWDTENKEYKSTILYDPNDTDASLLHRLLKDKAPHYSILHVDDTIKNIQRSFSFDNTSIYDAFQEVSEEIGCLFVYHSNSGEGGKIQRTISVYDLQQNCLNPDCRHRGEFTDKCPKCGSANINYNEDVFEDTRIFVTSDELASEGIQLTTDTDSVKNCFKLKGGDDLMTATIRNCNPNGTDYLWRFSDMTKDDMSEELVDAINSYDSRYKDYYDKHESELDATLLNQYSALVEKYKGYYNTESTCLSCGNKAVFDGDCPKCNSSNILSGKSLQSIPATIKGYSALMNAYYNTIDFALYLQSALMPTVKMSETSADEQADLLTASSLSPVAVNTEYINSVSQSTADSAVLSMAKIIVKSTYKVEIKTSNYDKTSHIWEGNFIITNYSDENDTAESQTVRVTVNNDSETFIKQKIEKTLNKDNTDDLSISGLFEKDYDDFCVELKKYALNPLKSFYDACDNCLNILIDQGAGNQSENKDLYDNLYAPYYNKSTAITDEITIRESDIIVIDELKQCIEKCRNAIQSNLNFEEYLGKDLWLEFCSYRRDDTYSNDNYISDGLNNAQLFERALEFIEAAENEIYKSSELQHSISTSLNNLLKIDKFKSLVDSFAVGNWIRVRIDDEIFKLRLLEYDIDFGSFENISVEFSDVTKIKNGITDIKDVIDQASSMATNYSSIQRQADQGNKARTTIDQWITDGLNSALVQIQSNSNEEVTMTENGLLCRSYDEITGNYLPEQLRLTHNIMAYTDNNWETVRQAIGKHNYKYYDRNKSNEDGSKGGFVDRTGYGMNSDFVQAGIVSGSQIVGGDIYSNNYVSGKSGSFIDLESGRFEFGGGKITFNGTELIVNPDNGVGLTEDEVVSIADGRIKAAEIDAKQITVGKITASQINTAGLIAENISGTTITGKTISGGSIKIGDNFVVDTNGNLTAKGNASFTGTITGSTIKGGSIEIGSNFSVDTDGNLTAESASLTSASVTGDINAISFTATSENGNVVTIDDAITMKNKSGGISNSIAINDYVSNTSMTLFSNEITFYPQTSYKGSGGSILYNSMDNGYVFDFSKSILINESGYGIYGTGTDGNHYRMIRNDEDMVKVGNTSQPLKLFSDSVTSGTSLTQSLSDKRLKKDYESLEKYESFFMSLNPVAYKYVTGNSGRTHIGIVAQDVQQSLIDNSLTSMDFAGFCEEKVDSETKERYKKCTGKEIDFETMYEIRYNEFTMLNTYMIQKCFKTIESQQKEIEELKHLI